MKQTSHVRAFSSKMPKSLEKTRKRIAKKKVNINALHENSRDCQKLRRAGMRDTKLEQVAAARRKHDRNLSNSQRLIFVQFGRKLMSEVNRTTYFQEAVRKNDSQTLGLQEVQSLIEIFVNQHHAEFDSLKKERRPGRPASTREDLLRMKIAVDEKEYKDGFFLPDLTDSENVVFLDRWEGSWSYLPTLKWVRISRAGQISKSSFPPKGKS